MSTEERLAHAIRDYITETEEAECAFVVRAVVVAEVIYADSPDIAPTIEVVGDVPVWTAYGLLGGALEIQRVAILDAFRPGDEP